MNSGTHLVSSNTLVDVAYHNIRKDIIERDERDMNREISPPGKRSTSAISAPAMGSAPHLSNRPSTA